MFDLKNKQIIALAFSQSKYHKNQKRKLEKVESSTSFSWITQNAYWIALAYLITSQFKPRQIFILFMKLFWSKCRTTSQSLLFVKTLGKEYILDFHVKII